jgi:adenylylsulfate kinase-like enzyme
MLGDASVVFDRGESHSGRSGRAGRVTSSLAGRIDVELRQHHGESATLLRHQRHACEPRLGFHAWERDSCLRKQGADAKKCINAQIHKCTNVSAFRVRRQIRYPLVPPHCAASL